VAEGEKIRLVAWSHELRAAHARLLLGREYHASQHSTSATQRRPPPETSCAIAEGSEPRSPGHHEGEDLDLFPAITDQYPQLRETLRNPEQDHSISRTR
jgi:hypothetical protein